MRFGKKCVVTFLIFNLTACAGFQAQPLPPVPVETTAKLRERILEMKKEKIEIPEALPAGRPPAELDCQPSQSTPGIYICKGNPKNFTGGPGLFFAFEGSAQDLARKLESERLLRELVTVIRARMDLRDVMVMALLDTLDTALMMAEEYRTIAVVRGSEIERMRQEKILDRITLLIPIIGLAAGMFMLGVGK